MLDLYLFICLLVSLIVVVAGAADVHVVANDFVEDVFTADSISHVPPPFST